MNGEIPYRPDARVRLIGKEPFFAPGTASLFRSIKECGSDAGACESKGLSYSKGRAMPRLVEAETGCPIVKRSKGGAGGGSAGVTPEGERLLDYQDKVCHFAAREFRIIQVALLKEYAP